MTKTTAAATEQAMSATALDSEFRRLAHLAANGDTIAGIKLQKVEEKIEDLQRAERRRMAADEEAQRLAVEGERFAAEQARAAAEAAYEVAVQTRTRQYALVQSITDELAAAVKLALDAGGEARAAALRLGYAPGRMPRDEITGYISWKLGRDDGAGCDFPFILSGLRSALVSQE